MIKNLDMFGEAPKHYDFGTYVLNNKTTTIQNYRAVDSSGRAYAMCESDIYIDCVDMGLTCDLIIIDRLIIEKEHRGKGLGTKVLLDFVSEHPEDLLVGFAGVIPEVWGNVDDMAPEEFKLILHRLLRFYFNIGFLTLQPYYDCETTFPIVWPNKVGTLFFDKKREDTENFYAQHGLRPFPGNPEYAWMIEANNKNLKIIHQNC